MLRALFYAYVLGGITFVPLLIISVIFITIYTSVPVGDADVAKKTRERLETTNKEDGEDGGKEQASPEKLSNTEINDTPRTRKGWLTMRRTFEETAGDGSYVTLVRSFLDSRSKDPKRSRPKDMWYVVLKGKVLYLYEDEDMSECEAAVELSGHQVVIYPEDLPDGELFAKRNAICLKPKIIQSNCMPSVTRQMGHEQESVEDRLDSSNGKKRDVQRENKLDSEKVKDEARKEALDPSTPWFIFVRSNVEMEDWYFALIHASEHPAQTPTLSPLNSIFSVDDMNHLVSTLDAQPDVIPMRWLNALLGRIFFSHYRTHNLEAYIIGRLMKKLSKVKRPAFLTEIAVTQVSVGNKPPMLSKPMLKELTKEGDASMEVHLQYKGEVRITVEATAVINLGARFKSYTVKLVLAAVLKELEGNLLIKVKRPPSNRIWYAFTQTPRMVLEVEPIVSDRQITWGMILGTIESKFKEIIQESVVMPNMDDIAFFETAPYEHRGGIWPEAGRKPHVSTTVPSPIPDDVQSVASMPLPDTSSIISKDSTPSTSSKHTEETSTNSMERSVSAPVDIPIISTDLVDDHQDSANNSTRRSTWFNSLRSEDLNSLTTDSIFPNVKEGSSDGDRGRTVEQERNSSPRSQSTPKSSSPRSLTPERSVKDESEQLRTSQSSRRSSSSQFSYSAGNYSENEESGIKPKSVPNTPRKNSDAAQIARSASPPSFFSTLKSKAAGADKQAISNSAKEAIRKWGANWAGFKKDSASSSGEDGPQVGSSPPRSDGSSTLAQKARASYAEVRAAVAERKERAPHQRGESSDTLQSAASPTTPRARVMSSPNQALPSNSVYSEVPANPSIITSAARLTTPRLTTKKSSPSLSGVETEVDLKDLPEANEPVRHAPIHVQPVAKTMSIPGIHASHRGEVQSMGHVAAPQPPAQSDTPLLKNPAIQSVYRLWKNPSNQGHDSDTRGQPEPNVQQQQQSIDDPMRTETPDDDPPSLAPAAIIVSSPTHTMAKPTPPPLPPRFPTMRPATIVSPDTTTASQTLKNIVEKDINRSQPINANTSLASKSDPVVKSDSTEELSTSSNIDMDSSTENSHPSSSVAIDVQSQPKSPPALPPRRPQMPAPA
ncbi:Nucleus-vacuole junction protein 2 [Psilocybe cubensis]|uniref:SMP-LTD domain-containing protein n=2 Tax=Psilocybe cubensis TaxID=181762 RepID=A0A8H8CQA9_PSICU|nr:Nucleus-vacuole junction protein 2 [Psilocybe cubensis]KAH9486359.1 Nucleus-vacuole junction protein 2 [Psilocybe cubensis]